MKSSVCTRPYEFGIVAIVLMGSFNALGLSLDILLLAVYALLAYSFVSRRLRAWLAGRGPSSRDLRP